jgi:hypothetical protein
MVKVVDLFPRLTALRERISVVMQIINKLIDARKKRVTKKR